MLYQCNLYAYISCNYFKKKVIFEIYWNYLKQFDGNETYPN